MAGADSRGLDGQALSALRALDEPNRIRQVASDGGDDSVTAVSGRISLRSKILPAFRIDTGVRVRIAIA